MNADTNLIVELSAVRFAWHRQSKPVLEIPRFVLSRGELVFLQGQSGSGKTTLLSMIAAVLSPQSGEIVVDDQPLAHLRRSQRDQFRVDRIGLVFQQFNLLPFLSVAENIQLSCRFSSIRKSRALEAAGSLDHETDRLLDAMQLSPTQYRQRRISELSVGQQQRVAVARALIGRPALIIADEPTSALDSDTRQAFLDLLFTEVKASGSTLLFVSHDAQLGESFDRCVDMRTINTVISTQQTTGESA